MDTEKITPQSIEREALRLRVTLTDVLKEAQVSRGTYYRWRREEGDVRELTKLRLHDALIHLGAIG